jgi:geranylgeranyl pyrophosphate synthase
MKKGKLTLPLLLLLQHVESGRRQEIGEMIFRGESTEHARIFNLIAGNGVVVESLAMIERYLGRAEARLADLPANLHTGTLTALLGYIAEKSRQLLKEEVPA